jgi:hypothetical protein
LLSPYYYMLQSPKDKYDLSSAIYTTCQERNNLPKGSNPNMVLYHETIKNYPWKKENIKESQQLWSAEIYGIIIQCLPGK